VLCIFCGSTAHGWPLIRSLLSSYKMLKLL
jgi:hypothetical protein